MNWIPVSERVPDNRRSVLAWGLVFPFFWHDANKEVFLGKTKFNATANGGEFDLEKFHSYRVFGCCVTHWAEIEGPNVWIKGSAPKGIAM